MRDIVIHDKMQLLLFWSRVVYKAQKAETLLITVTFLAIRCGSGAICSRGGKLIPPGPCLWIICKVLKTSRKPARRCPAFRANHSDARAWPASQIHCTMSSKRHDLSGGKTNEETS